MGSEITAPGTGITTRGIGISSVFYGIRDQIVLHNKNHKCAFQALTGIFKEDYTSWHLVAPGVSHISFKPFTIIKQCHLSKSRSATHVHNKSQDMTLRLLCLTCFLGLLASLHVLRWSQRWRSLRHHHRLVHRLILFVLRHGQPLRIYDALERLLIIPMYNKGINAPIVKMTFSS